jgi:hypothetical protein
MARVIADLRHLLDHPGDSREGPEVRVESMGPCAFPQGHIHSAQIPSVESRQASRSSRGPERRHATASPLTIPPHHTLATRLKPAGHIRLDGSFSKESCGLLSSPFQPGEVSAGSEGDRHTLQYAAWRLCCHYIMRGSVGGFSVHVAPGAQGARS